MSALRAYLCSGGRVRSEYIKDTNQESKRAGKKGCNFTLNLGEIFSPVASELGCITARHREGNAFIHDLKGHMS